MTNVVVEGSTSPCMYLPTGERRTLVLTPTVQKLIDGGYYLVIDRWEPNPLPAQPVPEVSVSPTVWKSQK